MNEISTREIIDISDYEIQIENHAWNILELWDIVKASSIQVSISWRVFELISLGNSKFIPWYPPRN